MLNIRIFFKYSTYIGHSASNSIVLSSWFFYKLRKRIWIINLFKTVIFIKLVFKFLKALVKLNLPFWFINLDLSKEYLFKKYAFISGEFACTRLWIRGFLSNFKRIQKSLGRYILKRHFYKFNEKQNLLKTWVLTRFTWPRGIFLSNIPLNYVICKEAASISLPVVALVDTNIKSFLFSLPIPSNDDALNSLNFILSIISKKLLLCKYKKVLNWYNKYKSQKKFYLKKGTHLSYYLKKKLKNELSKYIINTTNKEYFCKKIFAKPFWKSAILYSDNVLKYSKYLKKNMLWKFNFNPIHFVNNCRFLLFNIHHIPKKINKNKNSLVNINKIHYRFNFLRKINNNKSYYKQFLETNKLNLKLQPLFLYEKSIALKFLRPWIRKKRDPKNVYFYYYFLSNFLRKSKVFHETFFVNLPSRFVWIRAFHKYYRSAWYSDPFKEWHWYYNYRFQLNFNSQEYWATNNFNTMLLKYWKYNKKLNMSDSAILFPINRWVPDIRIPMYMSEARRNILTYWLYPFFSHFSIKESLGGERERWYHSKFFYKEDTKFLQHFYWKLAKEKTPLTTFHFYNNWFTFCLKKGRKNQKRKKLKVKISVPVILQIQKKEQFRLKKIKKMKKIKKINLEKELLFLSKLNRNNFNFNRIPKRDLRKMRDLDLKRVNNLMWQVQLNKLDLKKYKLSKYRRRMFMKLQLENLYKLKKQAKKQLLKRLRNTIKKIPKVWFDEDYNVY